MFTPWCFYPFGAFFRLMCLLEFQPVTWPTDTQPEPCLINIFLLIGLILGLQEYYRQVCFNRADPWSPLVYNLKNKCMFPGTFCLPFWHVFLCNQNWITMHRWPQVPSVHTSALSRNLSITSTLSSRITAHLFLSHLFVTGWSHLPNPH